MALDRDLGVAFVRARGVNGSGRAWEMLAATGVRGLRLLREGGRWSSLLATENQPLAFDALSENARSVPGASALRWDARRPPDGAPYDYVDLDPYGSPLPFLETAVRATSRGGVLAVTATDLMVLAGVQPGACERRYGARPLHGRLGPEGGLRILLARTEAVAQAQGRHTRVLLAYVGGHHLRLYVEMGEGGGPVPGRIGRLETATWLGPPLGSGSPFGPMWLGRLADPELVGAMRVPSTAERPKELVTFLARLQGEAGIDAPFYYEANEVARRLRLSEPRPLRQIVAALMARGFRTGPTHARPEGFRTEAPRSIVEEVVAGLPRP